MVWCDVNMKLYGRKDIIMVFAALALCALGLLAFRGGGGDMVKVYLDGELYREAPLVQEGTIRVEQQDGSVNVIRIGEGAAWMESSTCKNQLCVEQGRLYPGGADTGAGDGWIICLPNRVTVELGE